MESLFRKTVNPHVCNCTKKDAISGVFLWIYFVNTFFVGSFHSSMRLGMFYKIGPLKNFGRFTGKHLCQSFFLEKVAHHQVCNFIKKILQQRCFTMNFAKLLKALCRTPPLSASNFSSTLLTLRPRKMYIYVFPALLFLSHFMLLIETRKQIY